MLCTSLGKSRKLHLCVLQDIQRLLLCVIFEQLPVSASFSITGVVPGLIGAKAWMRSPFHSNMHTPRLFKVLVVCQGV